MKGSLRKLDNSKLEIINIETGEISDFSKFILKIKETSCEYEIDSEVFVMIKNLDKNRIELNSTDYFRIDINFLKDLILKQIDPKTFGVLTLMSQYVDFENNILFDKEQKEFFNKISLSKKLQIDRSTLDKYLKYLVVNNSFKILNIKDKKKCLAISPYFAWRKYNHEKELVHSHFKKGIKIKPFTNAFIVDTSFLNNVFSKKTINHLGLLLYLMDGFIKKDNSLKFFTSSHPNKIYLELNKRNGYFTRSRVDISLNFLQENKIVIVSKNVLFINPSFIRYKKDCDKSTYELFL